MSNEKEEEIKVETKPQTLLVKSNALVNARLNQKYSLNEQKLILWVLSNVNESQISRNDELILNALDFANLINSPKENIYREAKSIATKLLSKTLLIENEEEKEFVVCNWFSGIRYKSGQFHIRVYEGLIPHIINLKKCFTSYKLHYALILQSSYAIRLYELLSQYRKIGVRTFEIGVLRMNLGIMDDELKQFGHFKTRVLDISEREINSKTDIHILWDTTRKGQKVTHVTFKITKTSENFTDSAVDELHKDLIQFGLSEDKALELIKNYDYSYLLEKLSNTREKIQKDPSINSPVGFFIVDVENNFQQPETQKVKINKKSVQKATKTGSPMEEEVKELKKQLESALKGQKSVYAKQGGSLMQAFKDEEEKIRKRLEELEKNTDKTI